MFYYLYSPVLGGGVGKRSSLLRILRITTATDYNFLVTVIRSSFSTQPRDADTCRLPSNVYRLCCPRSGIEVEVNSSRSPPLKTNTHTIISNVASYIFRLISKAILRLTTTNV